jgi:hypothetical protein
MDLGNPQVRRALRGLAVAGMLSLAVGFSACGDSDDDEPQGSAEVTTEQSSGAPAKGDSSKGDASKGDGSGGGASSGPAFSGDVEQAREGASSVDDVYESFGAAVQAGVASAKVPARDTLDKASGNESLSKVCDLMSEEAQKQTIVYAKRSAGLADVKWSCESATGLLLRRASQTGGLKKSLQAKIVGVNVKGDRATASVRFGGKGPISTIPLVKEDGEWKLAASPSGGGGK